MPFKGRHPLAGWRKHPRDHLRKFPCPLSCGRSVFKDLLTCAFIGSWDRKTWPFLGMPRRVLRNGKNGAGSKVLDLKQV